MFVVEGGNVWSNDILRRGQIDRVRWDVFPSRWRLPYRGWIASCPAGDLPVQERNGQGLTFRQRKKVYRSKMRFRQPDSDSVWNLQVALMARGLMEAPTAYYGRKTLAACAAFQRQQAGPVATPTGSQARRPYGVSGSSGSPSRPTEVSVVRR